VSDTNIATQGGNQNLATFLAGKKSQIAAALPKHLDSDRMIRLAVTCVMQNKALQDCSMPSIYRSLLLSSQTGLEVGVGGQAYLVPYKGEATFVPGWQGLVDLVSRSGRATVWTGAVFEGDEFDWQLGDQQYVRHRPGGENEESKLTHVYAIGRVNGSQYPVIEVWTKERVTKHRDKFNKVGARHYSFTNFEMYARKVALLQVLKYMPKSIELQKAIAADYNATPSAQSQIVDGAFTVIDPDAATIGDAQDTAPEKATMPDEEFSREFPKWQKLIQTRNKTATQIITMVASKSSLTDQQTAAIRKVEADMERPQ
jgi:recombination protein RecT